MALPVSIKATGRAPAASRLVHGIIVALSLVLVPAELWHEWTAREQRIEEVQTASVNLARSLVRDAENDLARAETALVSLVEQLEAEGTGPANLAQAARLMQRQIENQPEVRNFSVYGADGGLLLSSFAGADRRLNIADRDYFQLHRQGSSNATQIGAAVRSRLDGHWVVTVSRRFGDGRGRFGGVAVAAIGIGALARNFTGFAIGQHGSIALVRSDTRLMARAPLDEASLGRPVLTGTPLGEQIIARRSGPFHIVSRIDGVDRLGGYHSGERYPLAILVGQGTQEALAEWSWSAASRVAVVILLTALLNVLDNRLARQAARREEAERILAESEAQFRLLAEHASDMVARVGPDGLVRYASPAAVRLLGRPADTLPGHPLEEIAEPENRSLLRAALEEAERTGAVADVTARVLQPDGTPVWIETTVQRVGPEENGQPGGYVTVSRDVTERHLMETRLEELAATDGLTGLANRRRFDEVLSLEWRRAAREGTSVAVLLLDVDRFKMFNDRQGHLAGDDALRSVARALESTIRRPADLAARYGGEEFAAVLPRTDVGGAREVAERVRQAILAIGIPHDANESGFVTASVGVASVQPAPLMPPDASILLGAADAALYEAKRTGRNRVLQAPPVAVMEARRVSQAG